MIDPAKVSSVEQALLRQHLKKSQSEVIRQRAHSILLSSKGYSPLEIADILDKSEKTAREWIKAWSTTRIASLFTEYSLNQNAAKLTKTQKKQIKKVLKEPPSEYGLPKEFWDVSTLKSYIKAEFGVEYESEESYRLIFKLHNYSFHLPAKFDIRRTDEIKIKTRIKEIKAEITPYLKDPNWEVLVSDESRIIWEAIIRRCWLPKGQKSILKVNRDNQYQSFIGFLNLRDHLPLIYPIPWQNQKTIIKALKQLLKEYPNKRVCIIWDNAPFHKGKLIREALGKQLKRIHLINFPPYAPDHNPQEHIWKYTKDQISNHQFDSFPKLITTFQQIVMGRKYTYQI